MVDARSDVRLTQRLVDQRCPPLPQDEVLLAVIGKIAPPTLEGLKIETCFRTETGGRHLAGGGQQVGVEIAWVAAGTGLVHREIHGYLVALRQVTGKRPCQRNTLAGVQLRGQADLILACDARVVTLFGMLRGVPQFLAIAGPRDRQAVELSRQEYLGMQHVPAASVVDQLAAALVAQALPGTIGRCGSGAPAGAARHGADLHEEHGHVSRSAPDLDTQPDRRGCRLEVPGEVRKLLELRGQHRHFSDPLLADAGGAARATGSKPTLAVTSTRGVPANHLALADEA